MDKNNNSNFSYKKSISGLLHIVVLLLSIFLIVSISIDTFKNISFLNQPEYINIQFWVCLFFILVFFVDLFISSKRLKYLKYNCLFFIVSIPYLNIIQYYNIILPQETIYYLRFIPLVRGAYAMVIVVGWLSKTKVSTLFSSYITILVSIVYFSTLIFFVQEHFVNPAVKDYSDALWWAWMDVTTVGSNIYAVTPVGKVLSVLLAALGMMTFPIFTVYITSLFNQTVDDKKKEENVKS